MDSFLYTVCPDGKPSSAGQWYACKQAALHALGEAKQTDARAHIWRFRPECMDAAMAEVYADIKKQDSVYRAAHGL